MLRIVQLPNASAAKNYLKVSDYYREGQELPGVVGGKGARRLGLVPGDEISKEQFDRLCDNRHPLTGEQLTAKQLENRRVGWDVNFHAPKAVTLLYELNGDARVLDAHHAAVRSAMDAIEADMKARVRVGGRLDDRVTGNAVYSMHTHFDARPVDGVPDPHLHTHVALWNATYDATENKWKACELAHIKRDGGFYEALYHSKLAEGVARLGYGIERRDKFWTVAGVPQSVVDKFSRRTAVVEATAAAKGIDDPAQKGELGARTRERKQDRFSPEQVRAEWVSRLTDAERDALARLPSQSTPLPSPAESARFALEHAFHFEAVRPLKRVLEEGLRHGLGHVDLDALRRELDGQGLLTKGEQATTRQALATESAILRFAREGQGTRKAMNPRGRPAGDLTRDQKAGVSHLWRSTDAVTLVRGAAGVGKTRALKDAADGMRAAGFPVQAVAQSHTAKDELREVDPNAMTIAAFLGSERAQQAVRGGIVIVDEASLVGTADMGRLFAVLERVNARGVLVGDTKQHAAVAQGAPFRLLQQRAGMNVAEITEIVRQKDARYRAAVERFSAHDVLGGLDALHAMGCVHELADDYRTEALVMDYMAETKDKREVLVVAPTHAEGEGLVEGIRAAMKAEGMLQGEEKELPRLVRLHWSEAERKEAKRAGTPQAERVTAEGLVVDRYGVYRPDTIRVAVGDKLRATGGFTDATGRRVTNGTRFTATGFTGKGVRATTETGLALVIPHDAKHLAHAYVSTSYSGQGRTADVVLVAESATSFPAADRSQMYVSASRGRYTARVYTDDYQGLREAVDRDRQKGTAHDLLAIEPAGGRVAAVARLAARARQVAQAVAGMVQQARLTRGREHELGYG